MLRRPRRRRWLAAAVFAGATGICLTPSAAADDHGDGPRTATRIELGAPVAGTLGGDGDVDVFRFDLVGRTTVEVRTTGPSDTKGELRDSAGASLALDEDSGPGGNFSIRRELERGIYYVRVEGTGEYAVNVRTVGEVDDLHGDTLESSTALRLLSDAEVAAVSPSILLATSGRISPAADVDVFRIDVPYDATEVGIRAAGDAGADGRLVDSRGAELVGDAGDGNFSISTTLDAGIYYLETSAHRVGYYLVLARYSGGRAPAATADDHGDGPRTATRIELGAPVAGTLGGDGDVDVFRFDLVGRTTVEVRTTGPSDTKGELRDSAGASLALDEDSGPGGNFSIRRELERGIYYVRVEGTGEYAVNVRTVGEVDDLHGDTLESSTALRLLSDAEVAAVSPSILLATSGRISPAADVDVFRIDVPYDATEVGIRAAGDAGADGRLVDSRGVELVGDAGDGNFSISATLDAGIYYLEVRAQRVGYYLVLARYSLRDDHGDSPEAATMVVDLPWSGDGELERAGDRDVFRIDVGQPGLLRAYASGPVDTAVRLIAADGTVLAEDDEIRADVDDGVYYIEVRAADGRQTGRYGLVVEFTRVPDAPTGLTAAPGNREARLAWTPADDGGSPVIRHEYRMRSSGGSYGGWRLIPDSAPGGENAADFVVTGLVNGERTHFQVRAVNARGASDPSNEADATPQSTGGFSTQRIITTDADFADSVHAADLDGDGDPDVLSTSQFDHKVAWYENVGGGEFSGQRIITTDADHAYSVYTADLDGDGDADVLSASWRDTKVAWYENLGDGEFSSQRLITSGFRALSVHAGDLDGDGDADVVAAAAGGTGISGIEWYENVDGTFIAHRIEDESTRVVYAADLDGDGDADFLSASQDADKIAWYENLGDGSFSGQRVLDNASYASDVGVADLDDDGDTDVLAGFGWGSQDATDDEIAWYENLGGGSFAARRTITTDVANPRAVATADLDGDGDPDVLSASINDGKFAWYENLGEGFFSEQRVLDTGGYPTDVLAVDLDGDGDPDVLTSSGYDDEVAWYENLYDHGDDHGDEPTAVATRVPTLPALLHGALQRPGDRDVFRISTGTGMLHVHSNGPTDTFGRLMDADLAELASDDDSGSGLNFNIRAPVSAGVHYIEVTGFGAGPYTLSMRFEATQVGNAPFVKPTSTETVFVDGLAVEAAEDEVLVFLAEDITNEELTAVRQQIADRRARIKAENYELRMIQAGIAADTREQDFIDALSTRAGVAGANVNEVASLDGAFFTSNETGYGDWLATDGTGAPAPADVPAPSATSFAGDYWIDQIEAETAWAALSGLPDLSATTVGIVDTGVRAGQDILDEDRIHRYSQALAHHPDPHVQSMYVLGDDTPEETHGLWVSGYAAAYGNTPDRRGVNPHSGVLFVDVLSSKANGKTFVTDLAFGVKIAIDRGADVVNVSWGERSKCWHEPITRQTSRQRWRLAKSVAVNYARRKDVLTVWSAGNNCEKQDDRLLPEPDDGGVEDPSSDSWRSHALIVGASTADSTDACWSRMGEVVNIMAPGASVGFGTGIGDGTSFAAPLVAGAAGLVRAVEGTFSAEETRSILVRSADKAIKPNTGCTGTAPATTPNTRLNLHRAVQSALLAKGVELTELAEVDLGLGDSDLEVVVVTVPESGATAIDIGFVVDRSGSYRDDIDTFQEKSREIVQGLLSLEDVDVQFGVVGFADYPISPYGSRGDAPYVLHQRITDDAEAFARAIDALDRPLMNGGDNRESQLEAVYRASNELGWRDGALKILFLATDAGFHDSDTESQYPGTGKREVLDVLREEGITVVGLQSGSDASAREDLQELADATDGSVLSLDAESSQIVAALTEGASAALARMHVTLEVIAGEDWVTGIDPIGWYADPGAQVYFVVELTGQRKQSISELRHNVHLWARGDGSAVLGRFRLPIRVPQE
ncbi:MAG: FG-GAP-like repeat-containing protein [Gammaproteobacteria bacterium]|nr:FG-GAP-like repeat-containing protein [Gammaproteobacteria bacterium]